MRITNSMVYEQGLSSIQDQMGKVYKSQQQISTGKRIATPSDDPAGSARMLEINQASGLNDQYVNNSNSAKDLLNQQETVLSQVTSLIQDVQTAVINAGNPTLDNGGRNSIAADLKQRLQGLVDLANSTDAQGGYLFSGYQEGVRPFALVGSTVNYNGDDGQRMVQISDGQQMETTDTGRQVFANIKNGNGTFATAANTANQGGGIISVGNVQNFADPALSQPLTIQFDPVDATKYNVLDGSGATILPGQSYHDGDTIVVQGKSFVISGTPAAGDTFTVKPSTNQSLFKTLDNLIQALQVPVNNGVDSTRLANQLAQANTDLSGALDHIVNQRASVGARLNEIDAVQGMAQDMKLQYSQNLSNIQDVDYAQAASALAQHQLALQAAQQSFARVQNLSLFNYIGG